MYDFGKVNKNPTTVLESFAYLLLTNTLLHKVQNPLPVNNDLPSKSMRSSNTCSPRFGSRSVNSIAHSNGEIT